jgi:hypothetical protein
MIEIIFFNVIARLVRATYTMLVISGLHVFSFKKRVMTVV